MRKVLLLSMLLVAMLGVVSTSAFADNYFLFSGNGLGGTFTDAGTSGSGVEMDTLVAIIGGSSFSPPPGQFDSFLGVDTATGQVGFAGQISGNPFLFLGNATISVTSGTCFGASTCDLEITNGGFAGFGWFYGFINASQGPNSDGVYTADSVSLTVVQPTPEPASTALLASGLVFMAGLLRRKR